MGDKAGPESTRISKEIRELYEQHNTGTTYDDEQELIKALTRYVLDHDGKDWYDGYRQGLVKGREEAQAIIESAKQMQRKKV